MASDILKDNQCQLSHRRLSYIDVAKGLLILMVIFNHIPNLATASGIHNETINSTFYIRSFFTPFFMPAFFVIAGLCSNYNRSFKDFIISNAKSLLVPAVTLLFLRIFIRELLTGNFSLSLLDNGIYYKTFLFDLGRWNWFLLALFSTKVLFYLLLHFFLSNRDRIAIIVVLHILGITLYNLKGDSIVFFNFYYYQHALMYLIYIEIGYGLHRCFMLKTNIWVNSILYFTFLIMYLCLNRKIPYITSDPYIPFIDIFPHFVMSICGSLMALQFAKRISSNSILELLGRHSLVIYCLHFQFILAFYDVFWEQLNNMGTHYTITALLILFVYNTICSLYCSILLNQKFFKCVLGKF